MHIEIPGKPLPVNQISGHHRSVKAKELKYWREASALVVKTTRPRLFPFTEPVRITVQTTLVKTKGRQRDCAAETYAVKGTIDGLVDSGLLAEDGPRYVHAVTFLAPVWGTQDKLGVTIEAVVNPT